MRWSPVAFAAVLLLTSVGAANGDLIRITQIDPSRPPMVDVYLSLEEPDGTAIAGLAPGAFRLTDDGRDTPIEVSSGAPFAVVLVLDRSAQMSPEALEALRAATRAFVADRRPSERIALVTFGGSVTVDHGFDMDGSLLAGKIEAIRGGGGADPYDALAQALSLLRDVGGRRAVIVVASGADDASGSKLEAVVDQAIRDDASIFAIGLSARPTDQQPLQRLAGAAYGDFVFTSPEGLLARYRRIRDQLRSEYLLRYRSASSDPATRSVEVRVAIEDHELHATGAYTTRAGGIPAGWIASSLIAAAGATLGLAALARRRATERARRRAGAA